MTSFLNSLKWSHNSSIVSHLLLSAIETFTDACSSHSLKQVAALYSLKGIIPNI